MIRITVDIEDEDGTISVHTKTNAIGTMGEAAYAKAILQSIELAQKWLSKQLGAKTVDGGHKVEIIGPIGEG